MAYGVPKPRHGEPRRGPRVGGSGVAPYIDADGPIRHRREARPPMTATRDSDRSMEPDGGPSWLTTEPTETRRTTTRSFRLSPGECDRIDQAAAGVGMTTSAYLRSRVLGPGPDVAAWRRAYELLVELEADAAEGSVDAERVQRAKREFEEVALAVFPDED